MTISTYNPNPDGELEPITETEAAFQHGIAAAGVLDISGMAPLLLVPKGCEVEDMSQYLDTPRRIDQSVSLADVRSFLAYVTKFSTDTTTIFTDQGRQTITAILDYHGVDAPSWNGHKAVLTLKLSPAWTTWKEFDRRNLSQEKFAEFLEDNTSDIAEPDGSTVLETALNLQATKTVKFASGKNLDNDAVQLTYNEKIEGKGSNNMEVPKRLKLNIPLYEGGEPEVISVRLRYRINGDTLSFTYLMDRPEERLRSAFEGVTAQIATELGIVPLRGSAG